MRLLKWTLGHHLDGTMFVYQRHYVSYLGRVICSDHLHICLIWFIFTYTLCYSSTSWLLICYSGSGCGDPGQNVLATRRSSQTHHPSSWEDARFQYMLISQDQYCLHTIRYVCQVIFGGFIWYLIVCYVCVDLIHGCLTFEMPRNKNITGRPAIAVLDQSLCSDFVACGGWRTGRFLDWPVRWFWSHLETIIFSVKM